MISIANTVSWSNVRNITTIFYNALSYSRADITSIATRLNRAIIGSLQKITSTGDHTVIENEEHVC